MLLVEVAEDS